MVPTRGLKVRAVDERIDILGDPIFVGEVPETAVYDITENEYVRKADVDEKRKQARLQGLRDRLAVSDDPEAEVLRREVDRLEQEIGELTEFSPGSAFADGPESRE